MDDEYDVVNVKGINFKGEQKRKKKKIKPKLDAPLISEQEHDAITHAGWIIANYMTDIKDKIIIEFLPHVYVKTLNDGSVVLGNLHQPNEPPEPEEILTPVCVSNNQIALKTGYGRYLSLDDKQYLTGLSIAIGDKEMFTPIFENSETAICAQNGCFLAPDEESEDLQIFARATKVTPYEKLNIRTYRRH